MTKSSLTPNIIAPNSFNRPRMFIMGCGDVGLRMINLLPSFWRYITVNSGNKDTKFKFDTNNKIIKFNINLDNINVIHKINKQNITLLKRLASVSNNIIYMIPPNHDGIIDKRIHAMQYILLNNKDKNIVYVSTTGVYGNTNGAKVNETTPINPLSNRGIRRCYAENYLRKLCGKNIKINKKNNRAHLKLSIARVPGIYAKNRLPMSRFEKDNIILSKQDDIYSNHINADDLARILHMMLFKVNAGRTINTIDNSLSKAGDWIEYIADRFKLPMPIRMNKNELMKNISDYRKSFLNESRIVCNKRLMHELNFKLKYPSFKEGLD